MIIAGETLSLNLPPHSVRVFLDTRVPPPIRTWRYPFLFGASFDIYNMPMAHPSIVRRMERLKRQPKPTIEKVRAQIAASIALRKAMT